MHDIAAAAAILLSALVAAATVTSQIVGFIAFGVGLVAGAVLVVLIRRNGESRRDTSSG